MLCTEPSPQPGHAHVCLSKLERESHTQRETEISREGLKSSIQPALAYEAMSGFESAAKPRMALMMTNGLLIADSNTMPGNVYKMSPATQPQSHNNTLSWIRRKTKISFMFTQPARRSMI